MKKGIDVSYTNLSIDWSEVKKSGIEFAILRSTFGSESESQIYSQYYQNATGCVKNNIPFATYHFAYFVNEKTAKDEADFAIKKANEYKKYVKFIVLDVEEDSVRYAKNMGYNPDWTACSIAFMERIKSAGYTPVLYSNYNWLKNVFNYNKIKNYKLWYAAPDATKPAYTCAIWQYSWKGKVNGINGDVDMDYLYDDSLFNTTSGSTSATTKTSSTTISTKTTTIDDKTKFLETARNYIGKNGEYVCKTKLKLGTIYDWCAWFIKGSKIPQSGDLIFFRYSGVSPTDKYFSSHVGIVESVNGNTITTLEGNVDGNNSNWAETSTFKKKTRYLNDNDVYAFYRPKWNDVVTTNTDNSKSNVSTTKNIADTGIDVSYQVYIYDRWLPWVKNLEDFAGLANQSIQGVKMKSSKGHIRYRVKLIESSNYLPWVIDEEDYAGIYGKDIDCIQAELIDIDDYKIQYRVSTLNSNNYLSWVTDYNNNDDNGYAGIKGVGIDKLQDKISCGRQQRHRHHVGSVRKIRQSR